MTHRIGSHSDDWGGDSDLPCYCEETGVPTTNQPTNSIDSELEAIIDNVLSGATYDFSTDDTLKAEAIQAIKAKYISRKEIEEAIDQGEEIAWVKRGELHSHENIVNANYLRAKLLPPTKGVIE